MSLLLRGLSILVVFELGVVLAIVPWSNFWQYNGVLQRYPNLIPIFMSPFVRGAVTGLGLLDILIAFLLILSLGRKAGRAA
ncbi:MAG: hypothetical protein ACRD5I_16560 [Candidatus Acidiferrales bacterium]